MSTTTTRNCPTNLQFLKEFLRDRGLPTTGKKSDLEVLARLYGNTPLIHPTTPTSARGKDNPSLNAEIAGATADGVDAEDDEECLTWVEVTPLCCAIPLSQSFNIECITKYLTQITVDLENGEETDDIQIGTRKPVIKGKRMYVSDCISFVEWRKTVTMDVILRANCEPSMPKASEATEMRFPQVTITPSGEVGTCLCSCKASADGRCSHVAALLYLAEDIVLSQMPKMKTACTSQPQTWGKGARRAKNPTPVGTNRYNKKLEPARYLKFNPAPQMPQQDPTNHLLYCIQRAHMPTCAFETTIGFKYEDYCLNQERRNVLEVLSGQLLEGLKAQLEAAPEEISLSTAEGLHVRGTEEQSKNLSHLVAIQWGNVHEQVALEEYERKQQCRVTKCGFFLLRTDPMFGCSPDGVVVRDNEIIILEIKCL
ncbi:uncharacterized protein LOC131890492 isoform X2 [Tigriopus californicus]|uniref:uncharacterized protein LOC131890492 isoform X2 n=1 Tax=Tigriopus californicus TaxID=6832 RepID=UPI0027DAA125|nr:uncharacterized protein LOC131890492 isoform X2 [Tigriopus californicus]